MKRIAVAATGLAAALMLSACGGGSGSTSGSAAVPTDPSQVSGNITVLTQRTDLIQDGTLKGYAAAFGKVYPKVHITFQGLTDYEGEVKIRMNTSNYGDVLMIPAAVPTSDYPHFFAPLGSADTLSKQYNYTDKATVNGQVYGIASFANANGFVYNKAVWAKAGITSWPTTPQQFLSDLAQIKAKTAAVPYYTNYKDGWPLTAWTNIIGSVSCDPLANDKLVTSDPWAPGSDLNTSDSLLFDIVHDKLSEADPTTTNWENSKSLIANGKVATMWLGSWALVQMQQAAKAAGQDPSEIGYMPFPHQVNGHFCSVVAPDYQYAISAHSSNKPAARAWIDWMLNKSGYAADSQAISAVAGAPMPSVLQPYADAKVQLVTLSQAKSAQVNSIDNAGEVGLQTPDYRQQLIDLARGTGSGSLSGFLSGMSKKWQAGQQSAGS